MDIDCGRRKAQLASANNIMLIRGPTMDEAKVRMKYSLPYEQPVGCSYRTEQ